MLRRHLPPPPPFVPPCRWGKIAAAGLDRYFSVGGFGSDHTSRAELIRIAVARARAALPRLGPTPQLEGSGSHVDDTSVRVYHVGDTLHDLAAAHTAGVEGIGVASGNFTADVLRTSEPAPYAIIDDMTDTGAVLRLLRVE